MAKAARTAAARSGLRPPAIPKSPRGWRWFLAEFAVVAAGVLAALGAEQAVQTGNWRRALTTA